jgi:hypothetical protein
MNQKEADNQFKTLYREILRTHSLLLKKQGNMVQMNNSMIIPIAVDMINPEDMAQYMMAHYEARDAHEKWRLAQLKYFQFIENQKNAA